MRFMFVALASATVVSLVGCARDGQEAGAASASRSVDRAPAASSGGDPLTPNDTVMLATVATISQVRDRKAVEDVVRDAFRAADASGDGTLANDEFGEMLSFLERRVTLSSAFRSGSEEGDGGPDLRRAYEQLKGPAPSLSESAVIAQIDSRFGEADADNDGALDEVEFAYLVRLLKAGR